MSSRLTSPQAMLAALALLAAAACAQQTSIPAGFATYFDGSTCPKGWRQIPSAMGRLVVSVSDPDIAGLTLHDALANLENRVCRASTRCHVDDVYRRRTCTTTPPASRSTS